MEAALNPKFLGMPNHLENLKIVWWIDNLRTGGAQQDVCRFVQDFALSGARQSLICFAEKGNESFISRIEATGTRVYKIKKKKIFLFFGLVTIWNILRRDSFDISITCLTGTDLFGSVLAWLINIPVRISSQVSSNRNYSRITKTLLRYALSKSTCIVLNSNTYRADVEEYILPHIPIKVINNGVAQETNLRLQTQKSLHQTLGLSVNSMLIGCVSRLSPEKKIEDEIHAFSKLSKKTSHLVIVGDGKERASLVRTAEFFGVDERVHFTGEVANVQDLYASFSVFVLASSFEGMSNSLLEAMSNGCPVVVSHVDGNRELVQHRDTGLFFEPGNIEQLKEMLSVMLLDREFAKSCGDRARALVQEKYSEEDQFQNWAQLILRLYQSGC